MRVRPEVHHARTDAFCGRTVGNHQLARGRLEYHGPAKRQARDGNEIVNAEQIHFKRVLARAQIRNDAAHHGDARGQRLLAGDGGEIACQRMGDGIASRIVERGEVDLIQEGGFIRVERAQLKGNGKLERALHTGGDRRLNGAYLVVADACPFQLGHVRLRVAADRA